MIAKSAQVCRDEFLKSIKDSVKSWISLNKTLQETAEGVAHSILCIIDGVTNFPPINLVLTPASEDKEFYKSKGEQWYKCGQVINDNDMLHELYC